jgi:DNA (cytosine-5)-methyltransferase 1
VRLKFLPCLFVFCTDSILKFEVIITIDNCTTELIDLFAGTGAFSLAFEQTGRFKPVFANDNDQSCQIVYDSNFETPLYFSDINKIKVHKQIPCADIVTAGFPCQPFSIAGRERRGFDDPRSNVFWTLLRILNKCRPHFALLENVKSIVTHDKGNTFTTIKTSIEAIDYYYKYTILNTCRVTKIPQNRERLFMVCFRNKSDLKKFEFPLNIENCKPVHAFLEEAVENKYYYNSSSVIWSCLNKNVVDQNTVYQYRRNHVRENKSNLCPAFTANMGTGGHNVPIIKDRMGIRKLTPRECFNLQGFPASYSLEGLPDTKLYKLAGNAVTVPVIKKIALQLLKIA